MKKRLSLLFVFAFFLFSLSVNAENKYLEKEFGVRDGYTVKSVTIIDEYGNIIIPDGNKFIMPSGKVTIKAEFVEKIVENPQTGVKSYIIIGLIVILTLFLGYILTRRYNSFGNVR